MFGNNLIGGITRNTFSLPRILNGISKTLGVVNQAIPLYKQAKPMIEKGRTLFKVAMEMTKSPSTNSQTNSPTKKFPLNAGKKENISPKRNVSINRPIFFQ